VRLIGAAATIDPGDGNTISTGDTLSLEARNGVGANAIFLPGEVDFTGHSGVTVDQFCLADIRATGPDVTFGGDADKWFEQQTQFVLKSGGTAIVTGPGTWTGRDKRLVNEGGTLEVKGGATVVFGPILGPLQPAPSIFQTAGVTKLHSGSTLRGRSAGMSLSGGEFDIVADSQPGDQTPAKLDCDLQFSGGLIGYLGSYWTFEVTGNVTWTAGTYAPRVDVTANEGAGLADIWLIDGTLNVPQNSTAQIQPSSVNYENGLPANFRVTIFDIKGGLVANSKTPTMVNQTPGPVYQIFVFNGTGDERLWKLGPG
jgi:hypothetical protein